MTGVQVTHSNGEYFARQVMGFQKGALTHAEVGQGEHSSMEEWGKESSYPWRSGARGALIHGGVGQGEHSSIAGGNENLYSHSGNQSGNSSGRWELIYLKS